MKRVTGFSLTIIFALCQILAFSFSLSAKAADESKRHKPSRNSTKSKSNSVKENTAQAPTYQKNSLDLKIDELISKHIGEKKYQRTTIYDVYPQMPSDSKGEKKELADYLNYARKDLQKISQGELLKPIKLNFDQDSKLDYATIVTNKKNAKERFLLIANEDEVLLFSPFFGTHLELHNYGQYPTVVPLKSSKKTINGPAIKLVSFESQSCLLHFDRTKKEWDTTVIPF